MNTPADEAKANARVQTALRHVANAAVELHLSLAALGADAPHLGSTVMALVPGLLDEAIEDGLSRVRVNAPQTFDQPDRCPRCDCDNCGHLLGQHTDTACTGPDCAAYPEYACTAFMPSKRIGFITEQLGPLLSTHLGPKAQRRCVAVAHAAHHALHDYDHPVTPEA